MLKVLIRPFLPVLESPIGALKYALNEKRKEDFSQKTNHGANTRRKAFSKKHL